jgi:uncharacterized membrane protein
MATPRTVSASLADDNSTSSVSRVQLLICLGALLVGIATWFVAFRSPLWLDETWTYWQISGAAHELWSRNALTNDAPGYDFLLWGWAKLFGTSEWVLRLPSVFAMAAALVVFYRAGRIFLNRQTALVATLLLAVHPVVVFAAIDVRPYAFEALASTVTYYLLFRYRNSNSVWSAASFGCAASFMVGFHYFSAAIVPAILVCIVMLHEGSTKALRKKLGVACLTFLVPVSALLPNLLRIFHTRTSHIYQTRPTVLRLFFALIAPESLFAFVVMLITLLAGNRLPDDRSDSFPATKWITAALLLGVLPILFFFAISTLTPIHIFVPRYYLAALPGCALASALLIQKVFEPTRQALFCISLAVVSALFSLTPTARHHEYTWKYALAAADATPHRITLRW